MNVMARVYDSHLGLVIKAALVKGQNLLAKHDYSPFQEDVWKYMSLIGRYCISIQLHCTIEKDFGRGAQK